MKKLISALLTTIFVFAAMPFSVSATENISSEQQEIIDLACEVFPEYSNKIKTQEVTSSHARSGSNRVLVASETRHVSDNEVMMYSEYSDGIILLTDYEFEHTETTNSYDSNPMTTTVNLNIKATCTNVTGYFLLSGVEYMLINGSYDCITKVGTPSYSGKCSLHTAYTPRLSESAAGNACIDYRLNFQFGPGGYYTFNSLLTLSVGKDTATITHVNNT